MKDVILLKLDCQGERWTSGQVLYLAIFGMYCRFGNLDVAC